MLLLALRRYLAYPGHQTPGQWVEEVSESLLSLSELYPDPSDDREH